jgi:hypothetical protein
MEKPSNALLSPLSTLLPPGDLLLLASRRGEDGASGGEEGEPRVGEEEEEDEDEDTDRGESPGGFRAAAANPLLLPGLPLLLPGLLSRLLLVVGELAAKPLLVRGVTRRGPLPEFRAVRGEEARGAGPEEKEEEEEEEEAVAPAACCLAARRRELLGLRSRGAGLDGGEAPEEGEVAPPPPPKKLPVGLLLLLAVVPEFRGLRAVGVALLLFLDGDEEVGKAARSVVRGFKALPPPPPLLAPVRGDAGRLLGLRLGPAADIEVPRALAFDQWV